MPKVKILPPELVSKIAAGEVVERPASVVKELVENALDADASAIEVHLKEAGKQSILIKDNGSGIEKEDLENIFLRHATSKIQFLDDLFAIQSLGFRGEALYSIAAIADIILRTKTKEDTSGWELHMRGGKKIDLKPSAFGANGTEIEIKELFFNTPARRKFLKTNTAELNQILNIFIPYTLLRPDVRFKLTHQLENRDVATLLDLPPTPNFIDRMAHCLRVNEQYLMETRHDIADKELVIRLVSGDINIKRPRRDMQFIFVNGRPVQNRNISFHLNQIYRLIMPEGFNPCFAVYLQIPASEVDVNIHPAKREVKIKDEQNICLILRRICEQALMGGTIKSVGAQNSVPLPRTVAVSEPAWDEPASHSYTIPGPRSPEIQDFFIPQDHPLAQKEGSLQKKLSQSFFLANFINKFLLFQSGNSLLIIDQHAAAERIAYEKFILQMEKGTVEVQHLLSPILLKLIPQELLLWEESQEKLEKVGFSTSRWSPDTIAIHSHPQLLKNTEKAVQELLSGENIGRADHDTIARRACRSSVMAGDRLNKEEAEYQKETLLKCLDPFTCPHGRPTVIEISESFLDKQFLRTK